MNNMSISQAATVLGEVVSQATGQSAIANITTPENFVSVAQTALKTGYDPVLNAISQVWSRTIFATRPWKAPNSALEMSLPRFGNALRKLSPVAASMVDDEGFKYPVAYDAAQGGNPLGDGLSVDMYKIHKQKVLQTNFYGTAVYQQSFTIFKDQLDTAFSGAEEFGRFNAMMLTERANDRERYRAAVARGLQANFIASILDEGQDSRVVHLVTEYNAESGLNLTPQTVYQPENYAPFMRWAWARVKTVIGLMGEDSQLYQTVINGMPVLRHTRPENMRVAIYSKVWEQMQSMVLSDTYHDDYLKGITFESVNFWQDIETPDSIAIQPTYTSTTGEVKKAAAVVEQAGIFALIHDRDGLGYCYTRDEAAMTPYNTKGRYWNEDYNAAIKTIQDNTEKAVVFLLD